MKEPDALGFVGNRLIPDQNSCDIHGKITISGETTGQGVGEHAEPEQKCLGENHIFQMQKPQQTYGDKGHDCPDSSICAIRPAERCSPCIRLRTTTVRR